MGDGEREGGCLGNRVKMRERRNSSNEFYGSNVSYDAWSLNEKSKE